MYQSCKKKCADNNNLFSDYNCIQLSYFDSVGNTKNYVPVITEMESNKILKRAVFNSILYSQQPIFFGDYLPFDFEHTTNTFVFNDSSKLDIIIISQLNAKAIYKKGDCGFEMDVDQPKFLKNTFTKKANCIWGNWVDSSNTISLKIYFK